MKYQLAAFNPLLNDASLNRKTNSVNRSIITPQENHVECLKICQLILTNYHQNIPVHVNTGLFEVQAARSCIELNNLEEAESHIKTAKSIFQMIYGDDQNKLVNENCDQICKTIEEKKKKKIL